MDQPQVKYFAALEKYVVVLVERQILFFAEYIVKTLLLHHCHIISILLVISKYITTLYMSY